MHKNFRTMEEHKIYEFIEKINDFKEIERKFPLNVHLDSDKILLFIDLTQRNVCLWRGSNTSPQMKSLATNALEAHFSRVSSLYNEGIREKLLKEMMILFSIAFNVKHK